MHHRTLVLERAAQASRTVKTTTEVFVVTTTHCDPHALFKRGSVVVRTTREELLPDCINLQQLLNDLEAPYEP
jgi:hypothetical protein